MDSEEAITSSSNFAKCCDCGCSCSLAAGSSESWLRSVKRKYDEVEAANQLLVPGFDYFSVARVQIENECNALRDMVSNQQQALQDLAVELEEERNASSSAANEAMSMILRLQREKAEVQMEARQFKRFVEEKMAHDQQELLALEDFLYKKDQAIQSLTCEVHAYKHRMLSYGLTESEIEGDGSDSRMFDLDAQYELPTYDYPPLKCKLNENQGAVMDDNVETDVEKYAFDETPQDHLRNLENRISEMEKSPSYSQVDGDFSGGKSILEKVVVGESPRFASHSRKISNEISTPVISVCKEAAPDVSGDSPQLSCSVKTMDYGPQSEDKQKLDNSSDIGDDMSDRVVYTIDSINNGVPCNAFADIKAAQSFGDDYMTTPKESLNPGYIGDPEIMKLYMRLQALEADRESMRQAIISMRTEKAQLVLLKEIAQHLCKEMSPEKRTTVKSPSVGGGFPFMSVFKWVSSFVFWRKKARRNQHLYGLSGNGTGLLMLLDKEPHIRPWRCLTRTQV